MKACVIARFGGNEVIQYLDDMAIPEPDQDAILVKNRYAAVNPVDWKIRERSLSIFNCKRVATFLF